MNPVRPVPPFAPVRALVRVRSVNAPVDRVVKPMGLLSIDVVAIVDPVIDPVL